MNTRIPVLLGTLLGAWQLQAQVPGSLDKTFLAQPPPEFYYPLAAQPDGKIIVGGFCTLSSCGPGLLARLNSDGTLDASFKATGLQPTGEDMPGYFASIAVQSDGKILLGGRAWEVSELGTTALARINPDGSVDHSFAPDVDWFYVKQVRPAPGGGCLVKTWGGVLHRLKPNGELDSAFSARLPGAASNFIQNFAVQPDGRIVLALSPRIPMDGQNRDVIRVLPDGSRDPSFEPVVTNGDVHLVEILADGKIVLGAFPSPYGLDGFSRVNGIDRPGLARLHDDGRLDLGFIPFADDLNPYKMAIQHDGKIVLAQFWKVNGSPTRQLVRLNTDGSRDETYVSGLRHEVQLWDGVDDFYIQDMVLQPDGKLVVSIQDRSEDGTPFRSMFRLHGDGVPYIVPASIRAHSGRTVEFQIAAATNRTVVVESSPDLKSGPWTMVATFSPGVGRETIQFSDPGAANRQQQFYRAISP